MSKFLSYEDHLIIAKGLQENASFGEIAKELGKDRTTIAKEIKKYSYDKKSPRLRTRVFYCDPGSPYQKGACEVNHELIRRILPKEMSFDDLTQKDIFLMMDHINSYKRKKLNNRSPYDAFSFYYGEELLKKLGWILRIQKFRAGIDLLLAYADLLLNAL